MRIRIIGLITLMSLIFYSSIQAQEEKVESRPFIVIGLSDGSYKEFIIGNNLKLTPDLTDLVIKDGEDSVLSALDIEDIASLGIVYHDVVVTGNIEAPVSRESSAWSIFDLDGRMVSEGKEGMPDYTQLELNRAYIVKTKGKSFKYIRIK